MSRLPSAFIQSLQQVKGFNEVQFQQVHESGEQVTSVRYNPSRSQSRNKEDNVEGVANFGNVQIPVTPVPWCDSGVYLSQRPSFTFDPAFHAGAYYVQEASSMFIDHIVSQLFPEVQPQRVLDLCAAPGGKSTLLAGRFPNSFIVSNEVIKSRVTILAENISKWGSSNVVVTHSDPKDFKKLPGYFNLMVVDAPCSGSGLFRKDVDAIKEWSEASVEMCSLRQQKILADAIACLKTNGYLIYSTCSYSRQEDEDVCDWIVNELKLSPVSINIDDAWGIVETFSEQHKVPGYRFYPDKVKGEGFFVACFQQQNEVDAYYNVHSFPKAATKSDIGIIETFLDKLGYGISKQGETFVGVLLKFAEDVATIQANLHMRKSGVAFGSIKGKDFIPHHELALSALVNPQIPFVSLDYNDAISYLKRRDLSIAVEGKGWMLVKYKGLNLGWIKALTNRVNNYYPGEWRILKH